MQPDGGYNIIVDDELGMWLYRLKGRNAVVIVDTCHSGGAIRSVGSRQVSLEDTSAWRSRFIPIVNYQPSKEVSAIPKGLNDIPEFGVFMAASRENELAMEVMVPEGFYGAFTFGLYDGMKRLKRPSYEELFEHAKKVVKDRLSLGQVQSPQIMAGKDVRVEPAFWSSKPEVQQQPVPQPSSESQPVKKPSLVDTSPQPLPEIKGKKILVRIEPLHEDIGNATERLRHRLKKLSYIEVAETEFFDRLIRGNMSNGKYHVRILNRIGDVIEIPPQKDIEELIETITPYLESACIEKQLAYVSHPNPPFKVRLSVKGEKRDFSIGEKVTYSVFCEEDCYLLLLNLDSQGNVTILFPNQYYKEDTLIKAGTTVEIPDEAMKRHGFELLFVPPAGAEEIKVIATNMKLELKDIVLTKFREKFKTVPGRDLAKGVYTVLKEESKKKEFKWSEDTIRIRVY